MERLIEESNAICLGCKFIALAFLEVSYRAQLKTLTVIHLSAVTTMLSIIPFSELGKLERQENKRLIEEAKRTHDETDLGKVENFRFWVVGSGQRRRVITIKKN